MSANPSALGDGQPSFVKNLFLNGVISGPIFCMALRNIQYEPADSSLLTLDLSDMIKFNFIQVLRKQT
jgi:hypothetical protein